MERSVVAEEKVEHPLFARFYLRMTSSRKAAGEDEYRHELLAGVSGRVIEVGAGNGLNFAHYPAGVTRVLAVEPDPFLRRIAHDNAVSAPVPVEVTGDDPLIRKLHPILNEWNRQRILSNQLDFDPMASRTLGQRAV